ncbi:MAG TPA: HAMP domain-containing sensor histidine kinase [Polyangiaceae bacterium]|nr:HAMP domain-containing sensor histidine kinase [Polyangiaceae bacterium]
MTGKGQTTLAGRVAAVQTRVTIITLALVTLGTGIAVSVALSLKTDQQLNAVLGRATPYLDEKPTATMDWKWLDGEIQEVRPSNVRIEVRDAAGHLKLAQGDGPGLEGAWTGCTTLGALRGCTVESHGLRLVAARNRADDVAILQTIVGALGLISLLAAAIIAFISRGVTGRAVRPLSVLASKVEGLEPGSGERLKLRSELAEIDILASRFDALVARFEDALEREKRFTAEASHELRTPLTIALAEMEALARGEGDGTEPARAMSALTRLSNLAESLLWFARAQGKIVDDRTDVVNICDVIRALAESLRATHADKRFVLVLPDEALVQAEEPLIARALGNLFDNAIKYGDEGPIEVQVERAPGSVKVSVVNGGAGIPEAARSRVFVPFFRSNEATPKAEGFGLGLPFARAVARAHGGDLMLASEKAHKTELVLQLPLVGWNDVTAAAG